MWTGRDSVGRISGNHYSRPDILRLGIDRSERNVVVDMKPKFDDLEDTHLAVLLRDSDSMDKKE
jgi:hypothetical protein